MTTMSGDRLSPDQAAAVRSNDSAIIVVASAGSGKTEVVARRVERLLSESPGDAFRVLALSYTLKAADELAARFASRLGQLHRRVDTNTVHGFAHSLLRQQGTKIGLPVEPEVLTRDEDRAELLSRWLRAEGRPVPEDLTETFQRLDVVRARKQSGPLLAEWEAALASEGALDYGSMLTHATSLLRLQSAHRQLSRLYAHVIVDEAQNLTPAQYELLTTLVGPSEPGFGHIPLMLVGDDKQSIVSFAGADPTLISKFEREYSARRFQLRQNFRSARRVAELGAAVARRLGQETLADESSTMYAAPGIVQRVDARDEAEEGQKVAEWIVDLLEHGLPEESLAPGENRLVHPHEIAVLGRTAAALRQVHRALESEGHQPAASSSPEDWLGTLAGKTAMELIALRSAGTHKSTHWQLARLLGADESDVSSPERLRILLGSHPDASLEALAPLCDIESPQEFLQELRDLRPSVPDGQELANWEADLKLLTEAWNQFAQQSARAEQTWGNYRLHVSRMQRGNDSAKGVRLLTIHRAQGREYRAVALVALNDGQLPDFRAGSPEERTAELRAFYVAVTRPSRLLLLSRARSRQTRYGTRATAPSPYLAFLNGLGFES